MKKRPLLSLLAVAAILAASASCRCSRGEQQPRPETLAEHATRLHNGLELDLASGPCGDSAALVVLLKVGLDHDPPGRSGMAQLARRLLLASTAAGRPERTVETGSDFTLYSVVLPADQLASEADAVAAWMSRFAPTEADVARERALLLEELAKLQGADAQATAVSLAEEAVRPTPGNGKRRGIASEVEAITHAELQAYWQAHFTAGNASITVAGRFDPEKVRAHLEKAFGALPAGTPPAPRSAADATVKGTLVMGDAPSAVAIAVPAPAVSDPLYPPFLILAARLTEKPPQPRGWTATYEPFTRPEILFITGPVGQGQQPEPAAARMRAEVSTLLARPLAPAEIAATREAFRLWLEPHNLEPAACAKSPRVFAMARARRAQLRLEGTPLVEPLERTTAEQLDEAAALFSPKRTAAVIAGGNLR
jgi:hypothetical protein